MFGVVVSMPIKSLAKVPELPKLRVVFFLALKEPNPLPYIENFFSPDLFILTPSFLRHFIVDNTSSDSKTFSATETFCEIDPIKKLLIEIDLSESTFIDFLKLKSLKLN